MPEAAHLATAWPLRCIRDRWSELPASAREPRYPTDSGRASRKSRRPPRQATTMGQPTIPANARRPQPAGRRLTMTRSPETRNGRHRYREFGVSDPFQGSARSVVEPPPASMPAARSNPDPCAAHWRSHPTRSARRMRAGPSASRRARSRTPRCPSACRRPVPAPAPGSYTPPCRRSIPAVDTSGIVSSFAARPLPCATIASPKSRTFTTPSGVTLMLAGLRSRWMIPFSCAASSASAS